VYNKQVIHSVDILSGSGKKEEAGDLLKAVVYDVEMQEDADGNMSEPPVFADHSIGLMIWYFLDRDSLNEEQKASCAITADSVTGKWPGVLDRYHYYKLLHEEAPYSGITESPSKKQKGKRKKITATVGFSEWLIYQPENMLEALLEHLALSGVEQRMKSPTNEIVKEQIPGLTDAEVVEDALNYAAFRIALETARGKDAKPWQQLNEWLKKNDKHPKEEEEDKGSKKREREDGSMKEKVQDTGRQKRKSKDRSAKK
jgi:hypothetical protein